TRGQKVVSCVQTRQGRISATADSKCAGVTRLLAGWGRTFAHWIWRWAKTMWVSEILDRMRAIKQTARKDTLICNKTARYLYSALEPQCVTFRIIWVLAHFW